MIQWVSPNQSNFYGHWLLRDGKKSVDYYNQKCLERREKYSYKLDDKYKLYVDELKEKGYCKIENFFDKEILHELRDETLELIKSNKNLKLRNEDHAMIDQPLFNTKTAAKIAFDDRLIEIAALFYNCIPAIGTSNLRQSYANNLPLTGTNLFHRDFNSTKIMKFFFYLNDVNIDNGPFTYVEGSNKKMFKDWNIKQRWQDKELAEIYGEENIKHVTANVGDLLIGWTNGWHKGEKARKGSRMMLTINFVIHSELADGKEQPLSFKIKKDFYDSLPEWKKPVADFLIKE